MRKIVVVLKRQEDPIFGISNYSRHNYTATDVNYGRTPRKLKKIYNRNLAIKNLVY